MLEQTIAEHTEALKALTAAIVANTETMRSLTPTNVVPITPAAAAPAPAKPGKVKPVAKEPEAPAEETPAPPTEETPAEEPAAEASTEHLEWDEPKLRLAIQEHAKTRLIAPNSAPFKEAFTAELARLGVEKAAKLPADALASFYGTMLTW